MSNYPPDGFGVGGGETTWDDGINEDLAVYKTGESSVKMTSKAEGADPWMYDLEYYPCAAGDLFRGDAWLRADSVAAGNKLKATLAWYTGAKAHISSSAVHNAVLGAANTWELKSAVVTAPANAACFRCYVQKVDNVFNAWFDSFEIVRMSVAFHAYASGSTPITVFPAFAKVALAAESYDHGGHFDTGTGIFTVPVSGIYALTGSINAALDNGDELIAFIYKNGAGFITSPPSVEAVFNARATAAAPAVALNAGDTIELYGTLTGAGAHNCVAQILATYLMGAKVE